MAINFLWGKKVVRALVTLTSALLLMTSCSTETTTPASTKTDNKDPILPIHPGPVGIATPIIGPDAIAVPVPVPAPLFDFIELIVRTDPADPHNERFLDEWRFQLFNIDDDTRQLGPVFFGRTGLGGTASIGLPTYMFAWPLVIRATNDVLFLIDDDNDDEEELGECRIFEIFVPAYCYDKAVWLLGPLEDAVWRFYKMAAMKRGEAWNPSQVDCSTWLANLQLLILTDEIADELNELSDSDDMVFDDDALIHAFQENQHLLTPTRPPICMAERRHNGGGMERGAVATLPVTLDDSVDPFTTEVMPDTDPIVIGTNAIVELLCDLDLDGSLEVNEAVFSPNASFYLDDEDFMGVISDEENITELLDVSVFNVRLGNGLELDHDKYDDACALTSIIEFTNTDDDEQDVLAGSGVTFSNLFGDAQNTGVHLTSDGDNVVDDNDYWAIFFENDNEEGPDPCEENVLAVELLGHRQEDFRDVLHMTFDPTGPDDLFLGLRADYELNEEEVDGERAFLAYTLHTWNGTTLDGRRAIRQNIANCYEASDIWARQFFITKNFDVRDDECCITDECEIESVICPFEAAEFAVRSQCFSNSRSNQRWRTDDSGFWSMNSEHGVHGDVIINPGWLAPNLDFEIYIQKFDEAVFKGPRTIRRTDACGQLMAELPTLVEGDRVLIKAEDNCCDDYDLVLPCVPEFTGFSGIPGVPYVPIALVPAVVPVPVPVPVPGPAPIPIPVP